MISTEDTARHPRKRTLAFEGMRTAVDLGVVLGSMSFVARHFKGGRPWDWKGDLAAGAAFLGTVDLIANWENLHPRTRPVLGKYSAAVVNAPERERQK